MGNFNRGGRPSFARASAGKSGHGFGGGGRSFGGGRDGARPTMHDAVCDKCGKDCQVPFRPTGDRPIFCSNCFEDQRNSAPGGDDRKSFDRPRFDDRRHDRRDEEKRTFPATCDKCHSKCEVPFRPMAGKPVYCNQCFDKGNTIGKDANQFKEQFDLLNAKLDRIIRALIPAEIKAKKEIFVEVDEAPVELIEKKSKEKLIKTKTTAKKVSKKKVVK